MTKLKKPLGGSTNKMKKKTLIAFMAMSLMSYGSWGQTIFKLSKIANNETKDYVAGSNPQLKNDLSANVDVVPHQGGGQVTLIPGQTMGVAAGKYTASGALGIDFFMRRVPISSPSMPSGIHNVGEIVMFSYEGSDANTWISGGHNALGADGTGIDLNKTIYLITANTPGIVMYSWVFLDEAAQGSGYTSVITWVTATVSVTGVSVTPTTATLTAGQTQQLVAAVTPSNATN
ncbi:MAG: Ig-like domain-containing protein, partial [Prevotellaceae bacterium]|nr:Ig-like domain-containing protein [Prevotellaceae bacterium]